MPKECVVLLHGLGRTRLSMRALQRDLENGGFCVWNKSYPSTKKSIEELSCVVGQAIAECMDGVVGEECRCGGSDQVARFEAEECANIGRRTLDPPIVG